MTDEEMKAFIQSELDKRMIPHPEGIVVEINERPFTPAEPPTDSILGRLVIAGREFMATLRAVRGNRMVKVILWVVFAGIPTFGFYFPAQYYAAKQAASLSFEQVQSELEANPPPRHEYVMVNYHWRQDENRYVSDRDAAFGILPDVPAPMPSGEPIRTVELVSTGSIGVPLSAFNGTVRPGAFTISGVYSA